MVQILDIVILGGGGCVVLTCCLRENITAKITSSKTTPSTFVEDIHMDR